MAAKEDAQNRKQTDTSLRDERHKADDAFEKVRKQVEASADDVVDRAQRKADDKLNAARPQAEAKLTREGASTAALAAERDARASEDAAIAADRSEAAAALEEERELQRLALAGLLRLEPEQTDQHLLLERGRADAAVLKRDDFLGMVSHDLRTILGAIALAGARLVRGAKDDEAGRRALAIGETIQRQSARMNRLIGDLIDVTSIESGRLAVTPRPHPAAELLREVMEAFQPLAAAQELTLQTELVAPSLLAKFDHERILQVLGNLIGNAIKFTPEGGQIHVRVEPNGAEVRFSVSDTGMGIAPDKREAIFERFWQAKSNQRQGLGLGLFISRCIVEAHGGRIWVEDSSERGSTLCFTLPALSPASPRDALSGP